MLFHGKNMNYSCTLVHVHQFNKAYQRILVVGTDELTALKIGGRFLSYGLEALPVMPKSLPLSHRSLIVDFNNAPHKFVIERNDFNVHSALGRFPDVSSRFLGQLLPPASIVAYGNYGSIVPFYMVAILWLGTR